MSDLKEEFWFAVNAHKSFNSAHEGYAVILEELDELWEHVRCKKEDRSLDAMHEEAIQIAAMAIRFSYDLCKTTRPFPEETR